MVHCVIQRAFLRFDIFEIGKPFQVAAQMRRTEGAFETGEPLGLGLFAAVQCVENFDARILPIEVGPVAISARGCVEPAQSLVSAARRQETSGYLGGNSRNLRRRLVIERNESVYVSLRVRYVLQRQANRAFSA